MIFHNAVASYNGDCVIHFHHPTWRDDRNDPATATRVRTGGPQEDGPKILEHVMGWVLVAVVAMFVTQLGLL